MQPSSDSVLHVASSVHKLAVRLSSRERRTVHRAAKDLLAVNDAVATQHADVARAFSSALQDALHELSVSDMESSHLGAAEACLALTNAVHVGTQLVTLLHNILHALLETASRTVAEMVTKALCALVARAGHAAGLIVEAECTRCKEWLAQRSCVVASTTVLRELSSVSVHVLPHVAVLLKLLWGVLLKAEGSDADDVAGAIETLVKCLLEHDTMNGQIEAFCAVLLLGITSKPREQRAAATALCAVVAHLPQKLMNAVVVSALTVAAPSPLLALLLSRIAAIYSLRKEELVLRGLEVARQSLMKKLNGEKDDKKEEKKVGSKWKRSSVPPPSDPHSPVSLSATMTRLNASFKGNNNNNNNNNTNTNNHSDPMSSFPDTDNECLFCPITLNALRSLLETMATHDLGALLDQSPTLRTGTATSYATWLTTVFRSSNSVVAVQCSILFFRLRQDVSSLKTSLSHVTTFPAGERGPLLRKIMAHPAMRREAENVACQMSAAELERRDNPGQLLNALKDVSHISLSASSGCAFLGAYVLPCCAHRCCEVRLAAYECILRILRNIKSSHSRDTKRSSTETVMTILRETLSAIICDADVDNRLDGLCLVEDYVPAERLMVACSIDPCSMCIGLDDISTEVRRKSVELLCQMCAAAAPVREKLSLHLLHCEYVLKTHPSVGKQADVAYHAGLCYAALHTGNAAPAEVLPLLIQKLASAAPSSLLQHSLLQAISIICEADWASIPPIAEDLVPKLVRVIQQQEVSKCTKPALSTLTRVLQCSGGVFAVFERHKGMYPRLLTMLSHGRGATSDTRLEIMRLIGVLGAVEPTLSRRLYVTDSVKDTTQKDFSSAWSSVTALLNVLEQPWHAAHHDSAGKAILDILAIIGPRRACLQVPRIVPPLVALLTPKEEGKPGGSQALWQCMASVLGIQGVMPEGIVVHAEPLARLIETTWDGAGVAVRAPMCTAMAVLARMDCNLNGSLETFVPVLCEAAVQDRTASRILALKACAALELVHAKLTVYSMRLTCECIASLLTDAEQSGEVKAAGLKAIGAFVGEDAFAGSAPVVVRALMHMLSVGRAGHSAAAASVVSTTCEEEHASQASNPADVSAHCMRESAALLREIFARPSRHLVAPLHTAAMDLINTNPLLHEMLLLDDGDSSFDSTVEGGGPIPLPQNCLVGVQEVRSALYMKETNTHGDFIKWYDALCLVLLRQSPRNALRAVADVAERLPLIARALLNVSFAVCHRDLLHEQQEAGEEMIDTLEEALHADLPEEVLRPLLNLSDYLERFSIFEERVGGVGQGTSTRLLRLVNPEHQAHLAESCGLYTKALRLAEYCDISKAPAYRQLVRVNVHLGLADAAEGITRLVHTADIRDAAMYADLGLWDEALTRYEAQLKLPQRTPEESREVIVGLLAALDKQSDWHRMLQCVDKYWTNTRDDELKGKIAPMVAHGAWLMSQWDLLDEASALLDSDPCSASPTGVLPTPGMFYRAVLAFQKMNYDDVRHYVTVCREFVDKRMATSSNHAYRLLVLLQHLTEVEEMIEFRTNPSAERRGMLKRLWKDRNGVMQKNARYQHDTHTLRTLVLTKRDNIDEWVDFAKLTHQLGQTDTAKQLLRSIAADIAKEPNAPRDCPTQYKLQLAQCEIQWDTINEQAQHKEDAVFEARSLRLIQNVQGIVERLQGKPDCAACYNQASTTLATWRHALDLPLQDVLAPLRGILLGDPTVYKAWSLWAMINTKALYRKDTKLAAGARYALIAELVKGLQKCVDLQSSEDMQLQEALRLLHIAYFHLDERGLPEALSTAISDTCKQVSPRVWATLTPQLVARLSHCTPQSQHGNTTDPPEKLQTLAVDLLKELAVAYPQVVLYPLVIEGTSAGGQRVLADLGDEWQALYSEARLFVKELIRLVETWEEKWISALARLHAKLNSKGASNPGPLLKPLAPLYQMVRAPGSPLEKMFVQRNGEKLMVLDEACHRWQAEAANNTQTVTPHAEHARLRVSAAVLDLWRALHKSLPPALALRDATPRLADMHHMKLHVPGSPIASAPVHIVSMESIVHVISSVHRPRKLTFIGSDGAPHSFLLKGKEDVRLDERIMQFLEMANMLLCRSAEGQQQGMHHIITYPVVPVARKVGLFGWVDNTENVECVISEVRQKGAPDEFAVAAQSCGVKKLDWETMDIAARVEALQIIEQICPADGLQVAMWIRAANSEVWLERRTAFARSLAIMSIIGYVIGLGDRHLGNILLHGTSGRVAHIDFEECFEAAMRRKNYPECVPFRLTRQLRNAMGAGGAGGVFRRTAICTTQALRTERHAILALIESFIYEPLAEPTHEASPDSALILHRVHQKLEGIDAHTDHTTPEPTLVSGTYPQRLYAGPDTEVAYPATLYAEEEKKKGYPYSLYEENVVTEELEERGSGGGGGSAFVGPECKVTTDAPQVQVDRLIDEASSLQHLARMYKGWRPWV